MSGIELVSSLRNATSSMIAANNVRPREIDADRRRHAGLAAAPGDDGPQLANTLCQIFKLACKCATKPCFFCQS
jgi:hypothetical protein